MGEGPCWWQIPYNVIYSFMIDIFHKKIREMFPLYYMMWCYQQVQDFNHTMRCYLEKINDTFKRFKSPTTPYYVICSNHQPHHTMLCSNHQPHHTVLPVYYRFNHICISICLSLAILTKPSILLQVYKDSLRTIYVQPHWVTYNIII